MQFRFEFARVLVHSDVQVFRALRADPEHVYLTIDAVLQIELHGGPQPPLPIAYVVNDTSITSIITGGIGGPIVVGRKVGTARVVLEQVRNLHSGIRNEYNPNYTQGSPPIATTTVYVHVFTMSGIHIHAGTITPITGTCVPMYATGRGSGVSVPSYRQSPFAFGGQLKDVLNFDWTIVQEASSNDGMSPRLQSVWAKVCKNLREVKI
jgi:hypothetical protein